MRWWMIEQCRTSQDVVHATFTLAEKDRVLERMDFEAQFLVNKPEPPALPSKFTTFGTKWHSFYEGFKGHLVVQRGCMEIPLIYVIREHTDVTEAMRTADDYDSSDARLIAIVVLEGDEYDEDNK